MLIGKKKEPLIRATMKIKPFDNEEGFIIVNVEISGITTYFLRMILS